jgi:dipeptidyl-peptidase-3
LWPHLSVISLLNFSEKEKNYVHYVGQASWAGARIIQGGVKRLLRIICIHMREIGQWTSQARDLYDLLILTFTDFRGSIADLPALQTSSKLSSEDWDDLLQYTIQVCLEE